LGEQVCLAIGVEALLRQRSDELHGVPPIEAVLRGRSVMKSFVLGVIATLVVLLGVGVVIIAGISRARYRQGCEPRRPRFPSLRPVSFARIRPQYDRSKLGRGLASQGGNGTGVYALFASDEALGRDVG